jgi:hypothetical protein
MTSMNRSCLLLLGIACCFAVSTTGCNLPVSKLAPKISPFAAGSHGMACCANGDCTASKLGAVFDELLPCESVFGSNSAGVGTGKSIDLLVVHGGSSGESEARNVLVWCER